MTGGLLLLAVALQAPPSGDAARELSGVLTDLRREMDGLASALGALEKGIRSQAVGDLRTALEISRPSWKGKLETFEQVRARVREANPRYIPGVRSVREGLLVLVYREADRTGRLNRYWKEGPLGGLFRKVEGVEIAASGQSLRAIGLVFRRLKRDARHPDPLIADWAQAWGRRMEKPGIELQKAMTLGQARALKSMLEAPITSVRRELQPSFNARFPKEVFETLVEVNPPGGLKGRLFSREGKRWYLHQAGRWFELKGKVQDLEDLTRVLSAGGAAVKAERLVTLLADDAKLYYDHFMQFAGLYPLAFLPDDLLESVYETDGPAALADVKKLRAFTPNEALGRYLREPSSPEFRRLEEARQGGVLVEVSVPAADGETRVWMRDPSGTKIDLMLKDGAYHGRVKDARESAMIVIGGSRGGAPLVQIVRSLPPGPARLRATLRPLARPVEPAAGEGAPPATLPDADRLAEENRDAELIR